MTTLGNRDPVSVLQETPAKLAVLLKSQPADVLKQRPAPGKWSVGEILAHLADAEMVLGFRVRLILGQPGVPIQAFDQTVAYVLKMWAGHDLNHREQTERILEKSAAA